MKEHYRDNLLKALAGLVVSVIMVFAGYFLNDILSRDRLSIEHVEFVPIYERFYPDSLRRFVAKGPSRLSLSHSQERVLQDGAYTKVDLDRLTSLMDTVKKEAKRDAEQAAELLSKLGSSENRKDVTEESQRFLTRVLGFAPRANPDQGKYTAEMANADLLTTKIEMETVMAMAEEVLGSLREFRFERTGEVQIAVTFLNTGSTDGLVRDGIEMVLSNLPDMRIPLRGEMITVPKKSMARGSYAVAEWAAPEQAVRTLKQLVKDKQSVTASLTAKDIRTSPIRSGSFSLPVADVDME